jgi:hypothetical protein
MSSEDSTKIAKFAESWARHDIDALTRLFSDDFQYVIDKEVRFTKKTQLRSFWASNQIKQRRLIIRTGPVNSTSEFESGLFFAHFYDFRRLSFTMVGGEIQLHINPEGLISKLEEVYHKNEFPSYYYAFSQLFSFVPKSIGFVNRKLGSLFGTYAKLLLSVFGILLVLFVAYTVFIHEKLPVVNESFMVLVRPIVPFLFAVLYCLQQIIPLVSGSVSPDLTIKRIGADEDLKMMANEMEEADRVCILSGDFSFISKHPKLEYRLRELCFGGKLELYSYKASGVVEGELKKTTVGNEILLKLQDDGKIFCDVSLRAKCTLIESGGKKKLLYRFKQTDKAQESMAMGVVKPRDNTQYLLDIFENVFNSIKK